MSALHASKTGHLSKIRLTCRPATADRWDDLVRLFGARGACAGCWCMFWRLPRVEFDRGKGPGNRRALGRLVRAGEVPGLLAYAGPQVVGWCALAPRDRYPGLARSRVLGPVDERPVWSVVCFFVARGFRRRGVTTALLRAAVRYVKTQGGRLVEGYPVDTHGPYPDTFAFTGFGAAFQRAGFVEVARRSPLRPVMRKTTGKS